MKVCKAESFGEYVSRISEIVADVFEKDGKGDISQKNALEPEILWFRGIDYTDHPLIPSLYRVKGLVNVDEESGEYTKLHYAEDIRTQHYIAKNYHYFSKIPSSRVEWLEVMQHHEVKTRVLDWSESSIHSLIFAVEAFLDGKKYTSERRRNQVPCVWVLRPQRLNLEIFKAIKEDGRLIEKLVDELHLHNAQKEEFYLHLKNSLGLLTENVDGSQERRKALESMRHLENIVNLSTINDELLRDRSRLPEMLCRGQIFPLFYLLSRIYSDGYRLRKRELPPLAVVQPYHSERIKVQKGVFTVFPFYREQNGDDKLRNAGIEPNAMQYNLIAQDCLCKIEIHNPEKIAYELMANGITTSWLYPELPIVSNEIENHKIY